MKRKTRNEPLRICRYSLDGGRSWLTVVSTLHDDTAAAVRRGLETRHRFPVMVREETPPKAARRRRPPANDGGARVRLIDIQCINLTRRLQVGDKVRVDGRACEVIDTSDPALVALKTGSGAPFKVGRLRLADFLRDPTTSRRRQP